MLNEGIVVSLQVCVGKMLPMESLRSANFIAGYGIDGDRHATKDPKLRDRQVLLIDEGTLKTFGLQYGILKENITSIGIDLDSLVSGAILMLGEEVELKISKECTPCSRMDEIRPGLQDAIKGRRGTLASVVKGGLVTIGDKIRRM